MEHTMKSSNLSLPAGIALSAAVLLNGCSNAGSQFAPPAGSTLTAVQNRPQSRVRPDNCTPTLWASSLSTNDVYGYTAANSAPCITLTGANSISFNAPVSVAIGRKPKYLYVADLNNDRVVVFTYKGVYVKWLDTNVGSLNYQPWSVCVNDEGTVGVANRQYNNYGTPGNVEFFLPSAATGSGPTGTASGVLESDQYCAFDVKGDFFVDGTAYGGGQEIAYLPPVDVPAGGVLDNSLLGSGSYWVGMYSRIDSPADRTVSVGAAVGSSSTQDVDTWTVSGPATGPLTFAPCACSPYAFTSYPVTVDPMYQIAPSTGGIGGSLYLADFGSGQILSGPATGGSVATYETLGGVTGVATRPTGQY
jgi:hypothetical protein